MERNNLNELLSVLEAIRAEKYPEIPPQIILDVINTQYENQADIDRVRGRQKTTQIIMQFLNDSVGNDRR